MKRYKRLCFLFIILKINLFAGINTDSLKQAIDRYPTDTASVQKLLHLSDEFNLRDQAVSELLARKAYDLSLLVNDHRCRFLALITLGNKLVNKGKYLEASKYLLQALHNAEADNDKDGMARACNSMGNLFGFQDQGDAALPYYEKSLAYYKEAKNRKRIAIVEGNIGNIYYSKSAQDKKYLKTAEKYYKEVLENDKEMKDTIHIISNTNHVALVNCDMGNDRQALVLLSEAEKLCNQIDDQGDLVYNYNYTGRAYNDLSIPDSGIFYFSKSLDLARKMNNSMMIADAYVNLAESHAQKKDFERAFKFKSDFLALHDSLIDSDNMKKIADAQNMFESEKKQRQIELLEVSATHNKHLTWALVAGSVLLLLLAILMYNRYALKNKSHQQLSMQNQVIAQKNKDITDSINYAKKIQEAMLPALAQIQKAFPESFVVYQPKDIVSGDFYWFSERDSKIFIAAVDCTGHGVPGAFMSMIGNDMLYDAVADKGLNKPGEVLASLNQQVKHSLKQNDADSGSRDGMDAALCIFDKNFKSLSFAGANRPLYLVRNREIQITGPTKSSIGGLTDSEHVFQSHEFNLEKGDTLYIFTDGFCDQFGGDAGKKFTTKRFRELLLGLQPSAMEEQGKILRATFKNWKSLTEQIDDVLVIGIRI